MKIISHRGNIKGPIPHKENEPSYIDIAIANGFDVEVDIRYINGKFWLGHDLPDHEVTTEWIIDRKNNLWFHCKDLYSACALNDLDTNIIKFCHSSDSYVLVSNNTIQVHDLTLTLDKYCVIPLMTLQDIDKYNGGDVYGICTDYPNKLIKDE